VLLVNDWMWEPELEELGLDVEAKAQFGPLEAG
jgi:hypothetical protein